MPVKSFVWIFVGISLCLVAAPVAHASPERENSDEIARQEVRRGLALFGKGEARAALVEFEAAALHAPNANGPHRYAAECHATLEEWDAALAEYEKYLAIDPTVSDADKVRARMEALRTRKLGHLVISAEVAGTAVVDGLTEVPLSGATSGPHEGQVDLAPGEHSIVFRPAAGAAGGVTRPITLASGKTSTVHFQAPVEVGPPPTAPRVVDRTPQTRRPLQPLAIGLVAGGATVLLTSAVLDGTWVRGSLADYDAATRSVANYRSDGRPSSAISDARTAATRSQGVVLGGYILGTAAALGGLAIYAFGPKKHVTVGASFNGVSLRGTF